MGFVRTCMCSLAFRLPLFTLKERKKERKCFWLQCTISGCHSLGRDYSELGKCKMLHRLLHLQYK